MAATRVGLIKLLAVLLSLTTLHNVNSQLQISRNDIDCIYPAYTSLAPARRVWPTSTYMISGSSITREADGSTWVQSRAGFHVRYYPTYKVVTNTKATDGNGSPKAEVYVLYHCGSPRPTNLPAGAKVFEIPLRSVSTDDTSVGEFMKQCNAVDRVAFASELSVNGCYQGLVRCGYAAPSPVWDTEGAQDIDDQVDAFITYSASDNPKSIAMSAAGAATPLDRAEWFKFVATYFNREYEAEALYRTIRNSYLGLRRAALAAAANTQSRTVVAWVYMGWNADFVVSKAPFKTTYVQDAGGVMVSDAVLRAAGFEDKGGGSWSLPQVNVAGYAQLLSQVDVIFDETYEMATGNIVRLSDFLAKHLPGNTRTIPAVAARRVYTIAGTISQTVTDPDSDYVGSVGTDWFERAVGRCDEVLHDFVKVLTPSTSTPKLTTWRLKWLLRLDGVQQQYKVPIECPNKTAQLDGLCRRVPYPTGICPNVVRNCTSGRVNYPSFGTQCAAVAAQNQERRDRRRSGLTECMITE